MKSQAGQALITLLFFMVIGITVISAAIVIIYVNKAATTMTDSANVAYYNAESGVEDGLLKLLRNPTYTGTYQALPVSGQATVTISSGPLTIKSVGISGTTVRIISVNPTYNSGILTYTNWREQNQ